MSSEKSWFVRRQICKFTRRYSGKLEWGNPRVLTHRRISLAQFCAEENPPTHSLSCEYLREFSKKFVMTLVLFSGARGKMIHEKNLKQKISWHCSFKNSQVISTQIVRPTLVKTYTRDNLGVKKSWPLEISPTTGISCDILSGPRLCLNGNTQLYVSFQQQY
jgi:hypothetical protein